MASLIMRPAGDSLRRIDLGEVTRLGAAADNDWCLTESGVAPHHARIVGEGDRFLAEAASTDAPLALNGARTARSALRHLDVLSLGPSVDLIFVDRAAAAVPVLEPVVQGAALRWITGPDKDTLVELQVGRTLLGRATDNGIVVDTPALSRVHAKLSFSGRALTVEDAASANGTTVNGKRITHAVELHDGDVVAFGQVRAARVELRAAHEAAVAPATIIAPPASRQPVAPPPDEAAGADDSRTILDLDWRSRLMFEPPLSDTGADVSSPEPPAPMTRFGGLVAIAPPELEESGPHAAETLLPPDVPPDVPPAVPPADRTLRGAWGAIGDPGAPGAPDDEPETIVNRRYIRTAWLLGTDNRHRLAAGRTLVGRMADAGLAVKSPSVSREHAVFVLTDNSLSIEDLGGANGTSVNGERIRERRELQHGDVLGFAEVTFTVELQWDERSHG